MTNSSEHSDEFSSLRKQLGNAQNQTQPQNKLKWHIPQKKRSEE